MKKYPERLVITIYNRTGNLSSQYRAHLMNVELCENYCNFYGTNTYDGFSIMNAENSGRKQPHPGQFKKGQSGNPAGKPLGARNHTTRAVLELLDGEAESLTRKAVEMALAGDTTALRLCLERLAPPAKDKAITVALPALAGPADASAAMSAVVGAMAAGEITPSEAAAIAGVVETYRRTIEAVEIDARLAALEARVR